MKLMYPLLFLFTLFFAACKECVDVDVPYEERIPYEEYETVKKKPKYNVTHPMVYKRSECISKDFWGDCTAKRWYIYVELPIENLEDEPVDFSAELHFTTYYEGEVELKQKVTVPANSFRTLEFTHNLQSETAEYSKPSYNLDAVDLEKKELVTKYRSETKYRKCNTCVEECAGYYKKKSGTPWWAYLIGAIIVIGIIRAVLQFFGVVEKD